MRLVSAIPKWSSVLALGRRLRPLPDPDPEEAGPTPQAVSPAERAELDAARPFKEMGGPAAWPVVGSLCSFTGADSTCMTEVFKRLRREHGNVFRMQPPLRGGEVVVIYTADDAKKVSGVGSVTPPLADPQVFFFWGGGTFWQEIQARVPPKLKTPQI